MKNIFLLLAISLSLVACDKVDSAIDATKSADNKLTDMLGKTGDLAAKAHLQLLDKTKEEMLDPRNSVVPDVPSERTVVAAKAFGDEATPLEIVQLVEVLMTDINEYQPSDFTKVNGKVPDDVLTQMEHEKIAKFTAVQAIAGFVPQDKIETIVQDQIVNQGRYQRAALQTLMTRALFIYSYRYDVALHQRGIQNYAEMQEAIDLIEKIEYIVRLPFASSIGVKARMLVAIDSIDAHLDLRMPEPIWDELAKSVMDTWLTPLTKAKEPIPQEVLDFQTKIGAYQAYWKSVPIKKP
jgi:hypothetical protein